jgi:hypothetical protein
MPKKLAPEIIKFRETLENLRKQHEEGFQDKRIDIALSALKGIKTDIAQLSKYVDDVIKTFETEENGEQVQTLTESNQQALDNNQAQTVRTSTGPEMDTKDDAPPPFIPFDATSETVTDQEELFPEAVKA